VTKPSIIALIPARAGSKRVLDKNIKLLGSHPLLAYTIGAALESGIFNKIIVSTDSEQYAELARSYGAEVPFLRPAHLATATSPDIDWVEFTLQQLHVQGQDFDCFSLLRPTSPFRQAKTIRRAWFEFLSDRSIDSLRAVEKCQQHPGKMWVLRGSRMFPLMPLTPVEQPWHSNQYAALPEVFVQNASLEMAWTRVVLQGRTIGGHVFKPFITEALEGFDINTPDDWMLAECYLARSDVSLPAVYLQELLEN